MRDDDVEARVGERERVEAAPAPGVVSGRRARTKASASGERSTPTTRPCSASHAPFPPGPQPASRIRWSVAEPRRRAGRPRAPACCGTTSGRPRPRRCARTPRPPSGATVVARVSGVRGWRQRARRAGVDRRGRSTTRPARRRGRRGAGSRPRSIDACCRLSTVSTTSPLTCAARWSPIDLDAHVRCRTCEVGSATGDARDRVPQLAVGVPLAHEVAAAVVDRVDVERVAGHPALVVDVDAGTARRSPGPERKSTVDLERRSRRAATTSARAQRSSARRITRLPWPRTSTSGSALPSCQSGPAVDERRRRGLGRLGLGLVGVELGLGRRRGGRRRRRRSSALGRAVGGGDRVDVGRELGRGLDVVRVVGPPADVDGPSSLDGRRRGRCPRASALVGSASIVRRRASGRRPCRRRRARRRRTWRRSRRPRVPGRRRVDDVRADERGRSRRRRSSASSRLDASAVVLDVGRVDARRCVVCDHVSQAAGASTSSVAGRDGLVDDRVPARRRLGVVGAPVDVEPAVDRGRVGIGGPTRPRRPARAATRSAAHGLTSTAAVGGGLDRRPRAAGPTPAPAHGVLADRPSARRRARRRPARRRRDRPARSHRRRGRSAGASSGVGRGGVQSSVPSQNAGGRAVGAFGGVGGCQPAGLPRAGSAVGAGRRRRAAARRGPTVAEPWRMATSIGGASAAHADASARASAAPAGIVLSTSSTAPSGGPTSRADAACERASANGSWRREQVGQRGGRVAERHRLGQSRELREHVDVVAVHVVDRRVERAWSRNAGGATGNVWTGSANAGVGRAAIGGGGRRRRLDGRRRHRGDRRGSARRARPRVGVATARGGVRRRRASARRRVARGRPSAFGGSEDHRPETLGLVGRDVQHLLELLLDRSAASRRARSAICSSSRSFTGMRLPAGRAWSLWRVCEVRGDAGVFLAAAQLG